MATATAPGGTDRIGICQAGTHSFAFDAPVKDLYFAFLSVNANTLSFSSGIEVLSSAGEDIDGAGPDACGY